MKWFDFEKKRPFVGETIFLCWSPYNGEKENIIYKCTFEKFFAVNEYDKKLQCSNLVLISGNFFCKYSKSSTVFTFTPRKFRWARLH